MEPEQLDTLEAMTTDQIRAAYEAGQLDQLLGRTTEPDRLQAALEKKLTRRIVTDPEPAPIPSARSGSGSALPLNGDPLERALADKLGLDPRRFRKDR